MGILLPRIKCPNVELLLFAVVNWTERARVSSPDHGLHDCRLDPWDCRSVDCAILADVRVPELAAVADVYGGTFRKQVVDEVPCFGDVLCQLDFVEDGGQTWRGAEEAVWKAQDFLKLHGTTIYEVMSDKGWLPRSLEGT